MQVLILSCSLNSQSRSRLLAEAARMRLVTMGANVRVLDLRDLDLPMCDGEAAYAAPSVAELRQAVADADAIVVAAPIYNYDVNAAAKNAIELTGKAWQDKLVGFLCAAGGQGSYMSVMGLANSLMLDFRCLIIPRFVYAPKTAFTSDGSAITSREISDRVQQLCDETRRLASALAPAASPAAVSTTTATTE